VPYTSDKQRRFFHTATAREHGITAAMVREYDESSKGVKLPESASKNAAFLNPAAKPPSLPRPDQLGRAPAPAATPVPPADDLAKTTSANRAMTSADALFGEGGMLSMPIRQ
jgi:hypothetical protein